MPRKLNLRPHVTPFLVWYCRFGGATQVVAARTLKEAAKRFEVGIHTMQRQGGLVEDEALRELALKEPGVVYGASSPKLPYRRIG